MNDLDATLNRIDSLEAKLAEWEDWSDSVPHTEECDGVGTFGSTGLPCTCTRSRMPEKGA